MQNSVVLWGVGAVVVIVAGIGAWTYMGHAAPQASDTSTADTESLVPPSEPKTDTPAQSLKTLIAYKGTQKCTVQSSTANSQSSGTVYVSNGNLRGDFTSTSQGKTIESHMIVEGNTSYVWGGGMPGGFKMSFNSMSSAGSSSGAVDPNAPVNYSCAAWAADQSVFMVPSGIEFRDITSFQVPAH